MYVSVKDNNIERALREFKKRVKNSNLLKENDGLKQNIRNLEKTFNKLE